MAKKEANDAVLESEVLTTGSILSQEISSEMRTAFIDYAMSVITDRAYRAGVAGDIKHRTRSTPLYRRGCAQVKNLVSHVISFAQESYSI